jgi:hypothetical protein
VAQKFITPITIKQLASAGSDALTVFVDGETYGRAKIEAGGRISWSSGTGSYDTNLYRDSANVLATDDVLKAISGIVTLAGAGTPTAVLPDGALAVDTSNNLFYFRSGGVWTQVTSGGGGANVTISPTSPVAPDNGDLWYNNVNSLLYIYDNGSWDTVTSASSVPNLDGGDITVAEIYEAEVTNGVTLVFDGGVLL